MLELWGMRSTPLLPLLPGLLWLGVVAPDKGPIYGLNRTNGIFMLNWILIGQVGRVFAKSPGDLASIPGRVIPKTLKMVLDTSLLNTQQYKVRIKDKVEQSWERSSTLPYTSV